MVSGADGGFQRGLAPIIAVALFGIIFYILFRLLWGFVSKKRSSKNAPAETSRSAKKLRGAQKIKREPVA